jgi:PKD repeat protein
VPNDVIIGQQRCTPDLTRAVQGIPPGTVIHSLTRKCNRSINNVALSDAHVHKHVQTSHLRDPKSRTITGRGRQCYLGRAIVGVPMDRSRSRHRRALVGLLAAAAALMGVLALGASPASAILERIPGGKTISYQPLRGASIAKRFDALFTNLDYSGGPVMPSNTNEVIYWEPTGYGQSFPSDYVAGIDQYFTDLAHDSGGTGNTDSVANQYNDAAGHHSTYNSSFIGHLIDTNPLPSNGCSNAPICITDAQVQAELDKFLTAQSLPRDITREYFMLSAPGIEYCFGSAPSADCSAGATVKPVFCAYHSFATTPTGFIYSNDPYVVGNGGCDTGQRPSGRSSDGELDGGLSHEHVESITDPRPNTAWTDFGSSVGGEIGDKCAGNYGTVQVDPGTFQLYNQVINGHEYYYQTEWSNQGQGCLNSWTSNGNMANASFTSSPGAGNVVNFDASGSTATGGVNEYVWQWNDDVKPGDMPQNPTEETTSPTISHNFPQPGPYTVALTVMAADGTSHGTSRTVVVAGPPVPAFSVTTASPTEGAPVSFVSSSTDPNPGGSIASYSWNFGDGSAAGSGPTPSHTFSAGSYNVTLTVMNNYGKSANVAHAISVSDEPIGVSFSPPAGAVSGSAVSFSGAGSDQDGSITSYSWDFGDGSPTAPGASPSHTYASGGTYTVTLTVTDSEMHTVSVSQNVTVTPDESPSASVSPPSGGVAGSPVSFTGSGSDPDGSIVTYSWNFGDGSAAGSGASASHTYTTAGTYTVTLTVVDTSGRSGSVSNQMTIHPEPPAHCVVPTLKGQSLSAATKALTRADCKLGKVKAPKHAPKSKPPKHKKWRLGVSSQSLKPGTMKATGTKVDITLTSVLVKK